jgi:Tol biopolymer transport system component
MRTSSAIVAVTSAALAAVLMLAPLRGLSQETAEEKAKAKAALKAKQIANIFENNATVLTLYDRQGKVVGTVGERALYAGMGLSPDRSRIAVIKIDQAAENADLFILDVATGGSIRMTTGGSRDFIQSPVWSPDGRQIAYVAIRGAQEAVYRRASTGEGPEELLYKNPGLGMNLGDWSMDGRFLSFAKSDLTGGVLYVLPLAGQGERQPVEILRSEKQVLAPRFSPDGRSLAYLVADIAARTSDIYVRPFDATGARPVAEPWRLTEGGANGTPSWRRDGKELYYVGPDRSVMVVEVSTTPGAPFQKARVLFRPPGAVPVPIANLSADGERFVGMPPPRGPQLQQLTVFDRDGKVLSRIGDPGVFGAPAFSPDGARLAVLNNDLATAKTDIWIFDIASGKATPMRTSDPPGAPMWSRDGKRLYYGSFRGTSTGIYRRPADGTGTEELVFRYTSGAGLQLTDVSADERLLTFSSGGVILMVPLTGTDPLAREAIEFLREEFETDLARFSYDGRWVAYRSNESERNEIYVRRLDAAKGTPAGGAKWQVSKNGVQGMLHWREDGREIFFRELSQGGAQELWVTAVEVATAPEVQAGTPKVLFKLPGPQGGNLGNVSRDGQRFVFAVNVPAR